MCGECTNDENAGIVAEKEHRIPTSHQIQRQANPAIGQVPMLRSVPSDSCRNKQITINEYIYIYISICENLFGIKVKIYSIQNLNQNLVF